MLGNRRERTGEGAVAERREDLRAADVDRAFVAERLKSALDEGRLSLSEYDERLQQTYAARTYGDLDQVMADLPRPAPPHASQVVPAAAPGQPVAAFAPAPDHRAVPRWLAHVWRAWLIAVSVNVVIWLLVSVSSGEPIYFWPMWVAGPWGAVLLAMTVSGLMRGDQYRPIEEQSREQKRKSREQKRKQREQPAD
jgi:Domain of unknown function (DUF1707)